MNAPQPPEEYANRGSEAAPETAAAEPARPKRRTSWLLARLALICVVAAAVIAGYLWQQERALDQVEAALEQGETKYALYLITDFLNKRPQHQRGRALKARVLVSMGQAEEAIAIFDDVGAASAEDIHAFARAFMIQQDWSHAEPLLVRTLDLEPADADALYELTSCQVRLGKLTDALATAQKYAAIPGQEARGNVFLGTIQGDMGNQREAAKAFAAVLKREPNAEHLQVQPFEFYLQYGRTLQLLGQPQESLLPLKHSVAAQENPEALVLLGNAALQLGEPDKAEQAWRRAVQIAPLNREARESLSNLALQHQRAAQALNWLEPLESAPDLPASTAYLFQRAYTLLEDKEKTAKWTARTDELRKQEEVRRDVENIMIESPRSFWARVVRARRFAEQGNWQQAELMVAALLKEAPGESYVIELADAIYRRDKLPALEKIPLTRF